MCGVPPWYHPHGSKISVIGYDNPKSLGEKTLILGSSAADIRIFPHQTNPGWVLEYRINHAGGDWSRGRVRMSEESFLKAFKESSAGDEAGWQGAYIRHGNCLNIPGPGTGNDGDPNVSIWVDKDIVEAVQTLLKQC